MNIIRRFLYNIMVQAIRDQKDREDLDWLDDKLRDGLGHGRRSWDYERKYLSPKASQKANLIMASFGKFKKK